MWDGSFGPEFLLIPVIGIPKMITEDNDVIADVPGQKRNKS